MKRARSEQRLVAERKRQRKKRAGLRTRILAIKVERGCSECGERHPAVLQFHHVNPEEKDGRVSHMVATNVSWDLILAEIAKCIVLCANCHAKIHWDVEVKTEQEREWAEASDAAKLKASDALQDGAS